MLAPSGSFAVFQSFPIVVVIARFTRERINAVRQVWLVGFHGDSVLIYKRKRSGVRVRWAAKRNFPGTAPVVPLVTSLLNIDPCTSAEA